ncbi:MAG: hypothetical protein JJ959_16710 [Nisaea sp.]|uniref:DUF6494 family protein n=1 Tax=Nisaea sp. TaxID=2024842 RepID=UPI001B21901A|nr:DUF6494 family protein [Nisaea sp.]MBO6562188.1 hypothetical protein [Nisaea sp.]
MNEDIFNMSVRKFLKKVGVTSQREIETAIRKAVEEGKVGAATEATVVLSIPAAGLEVTIDGTIETE